MATNLIFRILGNDDASRAFNQFTRALDKANSGVARNQASLRSHAKASIAANAAMIPLLHTVSGTGDVMRVVSREASLFARVWAGVGLATGLAESSISALVINVGALATGLSSAGVGMGAYAVAIKPLLTQTGNFLKLQEQAEKGNKAAAKELAKTPPVIRSFAREVKGAEDTYSRWALSLAKPVLSPLISALKLVKPVLHDITPLVKEAASGVSILVADMSSAVSSGGFERWVAKVRPLVMPMIVNLGHAIGNVILGVGGILEAFAPMSLSVGHGLEDLTARFARWGQGLSKSTAFADMKRMWEENWPVVKRGLSLMGHILGNILTAMATMATPANSRALWQIANPLLAAAVSLSSHPALVQGLLYLVLIGKGAHQISGVIGGLKSGWGAFANVLSTLTGGKVKLGMQTAGDTMLLAARNMQTAADTMIGAGRVPGGGGPGVVPVPGKVPEKLPSRWGRFARGFGSLVGTAIGVYAGSQLILAIADAIPYPGSNKSFRQKGEEAGTTFYKSFLVGFTKTGPASKPTPASQRAPYPGGNVVGSPQWAAEHGVAAGHAAFVGGLAGEMLVSKEWKAKYGKSYAAWLRKVGQEGGLALGQGTRSGTDKSMPPAGKSAIGSFKTGVGEAGRTLPGYMTQHVHTPMKAGFQAAFTAVQHAAGNTVGAVLRNFGKVPGGTGESFHGAQRNAKGWLGQMQSDVSTAFGRMQRTINALHGKQVKVTVTGSGAGGVAIHGPGVYKTYQVLPYGVHFAGGGKVPGHGHGDSVLGWLEPGETVVPKWLTPVVAPLMKLHGIKGFAAGGLVGMANYAGSVLGGAVARAEGQFLQAALASISRMMRSGYGGGAGSATVRGWLTAALDITGTPLDWMRGMVQLVMRESGGDPRAWNKTAVMGQHASGLLQTLPSTFYAYRLFGSIWDAVANAVAAIRYIKDRYITVYNIPNLFGGAYQGYAAGGPITEPVFGLGLRTGTRMRFHEGEYVAGGDMVKALGVIAGLLEALIGAVDDNADRTAAGVAGALGGAAHSAVYGGIYGAR